MNQWDDMIRDIRRNSGLDLEDQSEEIVVVKPKRDAIQEAIDLAGLNDYQRRPDV